MLFVVIHYIHSKMQIDFITYYVKIVLLELGSPSSNKG